MKKLSYKVTFTTPAFLGNAEQSGQWRTPPFKALLRHWWRIAVAKDLGYDVMKIREEEGRLFGNAWLDNGVTKSQVRMRLNKWGKGSEGWKRLPPVGDGKTSVAADLYLGYGPVVYSKSSGTSLKSGAAIQAEDSAILSLMAPANDEKKIIDALLLMDQFGTIGGRSRNGWGSVSLVSQDEMPKLKIDANDFKSTLDDALKRDWPHALGCDDKGLLFWETEHVGDWREAITQLAQLRKSLNANFKGTERRWLSTPVTGDRKWQGKRIPSSLRFKVDLTDQGRMKGLVFHLPCLPPRDFRPDGQHLITLWRKVHDFLDRQDHLKRASS